MIAMLKHKFLYLARPADEHTRIMLICNSVQNPAHTFRLCYNGTTF